MKQGVFAELKVGKSSVKYMHNGKIVYSGPKGKAIFAAVMNYMNFIGRNNPLPAMVAIHKKIEDSTYHMDPASRPETELSRLNRALKSASGETEAMNIVAKIHDAQKHAPEIDWDIAEEMMRSEDPTNAAR
jgi:hypothetical protein